MSFEDVEFVGVTVAFIVVAASVVLVPSSVEVSEDTDDAVGIVDDESDGSVGEDAVEEDPTVEMVALLSTVVGI